MLQFLFLALVLGSAFSSPAPRNPDDTEDEMVVDSFDPILGFAREESSLNEMFREVEELMEDTQHKLNNAVQESPTFEFMMEMEGEGPAEAGADVDPEMLPPDYHNESNTESQEGNNTIHTHQEIDKVTDNQTGSIIYSKTVITSVKDDDIERNHECFIDEDCGTGKYCQITTFEYKCRLCKSQEKCSRDGECCDEEMCVWGVCASDISKGDNGTICEIQQDCNAGLCCAVQANLLYPVCSPMLREGAKCQDPSNTLLDVITWEMEPDGVLDQCPCATGLTCQPESDEDSVSICKQPSLNEETRSNEDMYTVDTEDLPFLSATPREAIDDFDKINIIKAMNKELEDFKTGRSDTADVQEPDVQEPDIPDLTLEGDI